MKISILFTYKENYSPEYPGAVSLFVASMIKLSKFKSSLKYMVRQSISLI